MRVRSNIWLRTVYAKLTPFRAPAYHARGEMPHGAGREAPPSRAAGATTTAVYLGTATICRRRGRRLLRLPFFTPALAGWRSIRWESLMEERTTRESGRMQEIISCVKLRGFIFLTIETYAGLKSFIILAPSEG